MGEPSNEKQIENSKDKGFVFWLLCLKTKVNNTNQ